MSEVWGYVKQYQLGVDYTSSSDGLEASYDTALAGGAPATGCNAVADDTTKQRCSVTVATSTGSGFGVFLQQAFKRQGTLYIKPDLAFGVRYLNGSTAAEDRANAAARGLPFEKLSYSLLAAIVKPYIQLGVTPQSWLPDVFLSLGPAAQVAVGNMTINGEKKDVALLTSSGNLIGGFFELEIVFLRFWGDGAFSIDASSEYTGGGRGTKLFPNDVDGMSDFRGNFQHSVSGAYNGFGLKLVTPFP